MFTTSAVRTNITQYLYPFLSMKHHQPADAHLLIPGHFHNIIINCSWLDSIHHVNNSHSILKAGILEALNAGRLLSLPEFGVDPVNDLGFHNRVARISQLCQDGEGVCSHQLPDQCCGHET
ncbi:hypothetical protein E2C01_034513 [Portunus trituberculatus]|uniref:Uncharacterized protein n=1 Tax=Portunus trituberculatus TaxID=210409 RepID=A0A5B7F5Z1_PORTR|nr:hypothetical protein [Portunus trituberculatus]